MITHLVVLIALLAATTAWLFWQVESIRRCLRWIAAFGLEIVAHGFLHLHMVRAAKQLILWSLRIAPLTKTQDVSLARSILEKMDRYEDAKRGETPEEVLQRLWREKTRG